MEVFVRHVTDELHDFHIVLIGDKEGEVVDSQSLFKNPTSATLLSTIKWKDEVFVTCAPTSCRIGMKSMANDADG